MLCHCVWIYEGILTNFKKYVKFPRWKRNLCFPWWACLQLFFFNSSSHTAVNESLISWTEMSDTSSIIYLLPRLAELHLQQCLSSGLVVELIEMSAFFGVGGREGWMEGWAGALLCTACLSHHPPARIWVDELWLNKLSLFHGCCCPSPGALCCCIPWKVDRRARRRSSAPERSPQMLPLAAPRSWAVPGSCAWCSLLTWLPCWWLHLRMNSARNAGKHQKCWGLRRVPSVHQIICGLSHTHLDPSSSRTTRCGKDPKFTISGLWFGFGVLYHVWTCKDLGFPRGMQ